MGAESILNPTGQSNISVNSGIIRISRLIDGSYVKPLTPKQELNRRIYSVQLHHRLVSPTVMPKNNLEIQSLKTQPETYILTRSLKFIPDTVPAPVLPPQEIFGNPELCRLLGILTIGHLAIFISSGCMPDIGQSARNWSEAHSDWKKHPLSKMVTINQLVSPNSSDYKVFPDPDWIDTPPKGITHRTKYSGYWTTRLLQSLIIFNYHSNKLHNSPTFQSLKQ